jgi:FtsH-binding integral membrane protein
MREQPNPYASPRAVAVAAAAPAADRAAFLQRTYAHLLGAVTAFVALEWLLLQAPGIDGVVRTMLGGRFSWLIVLGAFMAVSWIADRWARSATSPAMQYLGLSLFVVAEAVIFLPLLYVAANFAGPLTIPVAGGMTLFVFGALTGIVFVWKADFSFLRGFLAIGGLVAMGVIVASILFGFNLGILFSAVMVVFASGAILYDTSNVLHHYRTDQHVSASLALFASVALLFWYLLRIVMAAQRN